MPKFVSVHPVITSISENATNRFIISETLKIGFIPVSFNYPFSIESNRVERTVLMQAIVMKLAFIDLKFKIQQQGSLCIIQEDITIRSKLPIGYLMRKIFQKQHTALFKNIEAAVN